jgi:hypothetical protein
LLPNSLHETAPTSNSTPITAPPLTACISKHHTLRRNFSSGNGGRCS